VLVSVIRDVVVVGAGVVGVAAGFELARVGHRVTVLSADVPGSRQSAGLSRIFRLSHPERALTDAAADALKLWERWERLSGETLMDRVGLLFTGDVSEREVHMRRHGGFERVGGARHPLAIARDDWSVEATGAATRAEATMRFLQSRLKLVLGEAASADRRGVTLTGGGRIDADRVVVCAGPDTYRLLGLTEPERMRSVRFSFALREPLSVPAPCWIQRDPQLCEPFYAVGDGPDHYSVGLSDAASAELPEAEHVRDAHRRTVDIVTRVLPGVKPVAERVIACEFSANPAGAARSLSHDGWDLREHDGVLGLTGPSLFKFAPLLGRLVVERLDSATQPPPARAA
jgi:glycine/D-amino acid oxidase-like deaminating enzyme